MREKAYSYHNLVNVQSIERSPFQVFDKSIYFIQTSQNPVIEKFISSNQEMINNRFKEELSYFNFVCLPHKFCLDHTAESVLHYYIPNLGESLTLNDINPSKYLLNYINYTGFIQNAFISCIDNIIRIVEFDFETEEECFSFLDEYIVSRKKEFPNYKLSRHLSLCPTFRENNGIELDKETNQKIANIEQALYKLRESGNLIAVLPIIEEFLTKTKTSLLSQPLSSLKVTEDYKILLPEYNNMEIKMSHLTKSIYLLFLVHEAIDLKNLKSYKDDLMDIYKEISNQENYDKMLQSVKDVVDLETNAIYVHLSRIKSAFCSKIDGKIAENYYIDGKKNEPKKIKLSRFSVSLSKSSTHNNLDKNECEPNIENSKSSFSNLAPPTFINNNNQADRDLVNTLKDRLQKFDEVRKRVGSDNFSSFRNFYEHIIRSTSPMKAEGMFNMAKQAYKEFYQENYSEREIETEEEMKSVYNNYFGFCLDLKGIIPNSEQESNDWNADEAEQMGSILNL